MIKTLAQKEAKFRIAVEQSVPVSQSYRTLFYGLKLNHERNVAVVHPLMFLLRRLVYAVVIVTLSETMFFGVLVVMLSCLVVLAYAVNEWQWQEGLINQQHIVDECCIYVCCVFLLLFSNFVETDTRYGLGYSLIAFIFLYVIYNTVVIVVYAL